MILTDLSYLTDQQYSSHHTPVTQYFITNFDHHLARIRERSMVFSVIADGNNKVT